MKDRIGQSGSNKTNGGASGSSSKLPLIIGGVIVVALIAGGAWFFLKGGEQGGETKEPVAASGISYPANTQPVSEEEQAMEDVILSAKGQKVPTVTQLVDLVAINQLTGTLESSGDGKNANVAATLETESLAQKAADFKASTNDDTIGWIRIPNTNVDYAVVYKAGRENYAYYEALGYDKNYSKDGVIWADYECTFPELSSNTILYGHNWHNIYTPRTMENMQSNDTMFAQVMSYHYTDFAQENPFIYFSTTEKDYVFQVFAAFYTDLAFEYNYANMSQEDFQKVIAEAKAKSQSNYNVPVTTEDHILTLSTCAYKYTDSVAKRDLRFVVQARLLRPGEEIPTTAKVSRNTDVKEPAQHATSTIAG